MSIESSLLAAIAVSPDDSLPRLVYADWLDEQGDPRAELVRVAEEMRRHPVWADEFQRLKPTRDRLREWFDPAWVVALGYQRCHRPLFGTLPVRRDHRWRLAEEFIDVWHGGVWHGDEYTSDELAAAERRLGSALPAALRTWYRLGGRRRDVWANEEVFLPPDQLRWDAGYGLVFRRHGTFPTRWYILPHEVALDDPPVYRSDGDRVAAGSLSLFALFELLQEVQQVHISCELYGDDDGRRPPLPTRFRPTGLPELDRQGAVVRFWEADDTLVMCERDDEWWYATCRTEEAYQHLVREFGDRVRRG